jgi:hypothetical protein
LFGIASTYSETSNFYPCGYKYQPRVLAPNISATAPHFLTFSLPFKDIVAVSFLEPTPMAREDGHDKRVVEEIPEGEMPMGQRIHRMR